MNYRKIYALMVLTALFWAGAFICGKICAPYLPPFTLVFLRFALATAVLSVVMRLPSFRTTYKCQKEDWKVLLAAGTVGIFGYNVFFFFALHYTSATNASIMAASNPIFATILSAIFLKQFINRQMAVGITLSFLGVFLTITGADPAVIRHLNLNGGDLLMLCAVLSWASFLVISKKSKVPPILFTWYNFVVGSLLSIPFVLWEKPWKAIAQAPASAWGGVLFMAVFSSVFAYCVNQLSVREIGPQRSAIFINLVPVFSMLLAVSILGEPFLPVKVLTMLIIVCGVFLCQRGGERLASAKENP